MHLTKLAVAVTVSLAFLSAPAEAAHKITKTSSHKTVRHVVAKVVVSQPKPVIIAVAPVVVTPVVVNPVPAAPARSNAFRTLGVERDNVENLYGTNEEGDYSQVIDFGR
jgi:hypothetical protein